MDPVESKLRSWTRRLGIWLRDLLFFERFDRVRIEESVIQDICEMAAGSWPKEMISFLTGEIRKEGKERVLLINGLYVKSYEANEFSTYFSLHDLPMTSVYGTVHSHPGHSNRPSSADRHLFSKYGWFHLIICKPYRKESIAVYNKHGDRIESVDF